VNPLSKVIILKVLHAEFSLEGSLVGRCAGCQYIVDIINNKTSVGTTVLGHSLLNGCVVLPEGG
jgi:hypothetical protein